MSGTPNGWTWFGRVAKTNLVENPNEAHEVWKGPRACFFKMYKIPDGLIRFGQVRKPTFFARYAQNFQNCPPPPALPNNPNIPPNQSKIGNVAHPLTFESIIFVLLPRLQSSDPATKSKCAKLPPCSVSFFNFFQLFCMHQK